jgi:hypothetical protein
LPLLFLSPSDFYPQLNWRIKMRMQQNNVVIAPATMNLGDVNAGEVFLFNDTPCMKVRTDGFLSRSTTITEATSRSSNNYCLVVKLGKGTVFFVSATVNVQMLDTMLNWDLRK